MYNFLIRKGQTVGLILGIICVAIFFFSALSGLSSAGYDMGTDLNALPDEAKSGISFFDPGISITFLLIAIATIAMLLFGIIDLIKFPKSAITTIIGVVVLAIIFFIFYSTSQVETAGKIGELHQRFNITDGISKMISGGLWTTLGLVAVAVIAMIVFELINAFK